MEPASKELKNTGYELFIAALSILSIVNLIILVVAEWFGGTGSSSRSPTSSTAP